MDAAAACSLSLRPGLSGIGQIAKARRGAAIIMANRVAAQSKKYHAAARHLSALSTCGAGAARPHIQRPGRTGLATRRSRQSTSTTGRCRPSLSKPPLSQEGSISGASGPSNGDLQMRVSPGRRTHH